MKNSFYTLLLVMLAVPVFAQDIKLNDLAKIDLFSSGPWWAEPGMRWVEVIPEGKEWSSYHLRSQERPKLLRDSARRLIKTVSVKDLEQLLACINKPDTTLKLKHFNISKTELKQYIDTIQNAAKKTLSFRPDRDDSLLVNLTAAQRACFFKTIDSRRMVEDAGLKAFYPFLESDLSYYGIVFTHKDKHRDSIYAYVKSSDLYHLPWQINNRKSYDERITRLFESMMGNEGYDKKEKANLIYLIDRELYKRGVLPQILWANYKVNYPAYYKRLSKTLTPVSGLVVFKSSRLPDNILFRFNYINNDTLNPVKYNRYEQDLINLYKKGGFFFDYMKKHPGTVATVLDVQSKTYEQVKTVCPDISQFDIHQIKYISTYANFYQGTDFKRHAGWLLLPGGSMILLFCSDQLILDGDKIFSGLSLTGDKSSGYLCLVFDRPGHRITNHESLLKIDKN